MTRKSLELFYGGNSEEGLKSPSWLCRCAAPSNCIWAFPAVIMVLLHLVFWWEWPYLRLTQFRCSRAKGSFRLALIRQQWQIWCRHLRNFQWANTTFWIKKQLTHSWWFPAAFLSPSTHPGQRPPDITAFSLVVIFLLQTVHSQTFSLTGHQEFSPQNNQPPPRASQHCTRSHYETSTQVRGAKISFCKWWWRPGREQSSRVRRSLSLQGIHSILFFFFLEML